MTPHAFCRLVLALVGLFAGQWLHSVVAAPLGSAFIYQGRLLANGGPATGNYDLRFTVYDALNGGSVQTMAVHLSNVPVTNGVFTVTLDFGSNVFTGADCWLEIGVRPAGVVEDYVILAPRQALRAAPYAVYSLTAERLAGPLPITQLPGNVARLDDSPVFTGTVAAATFRGDGAGLSNVAAGALSARLAQRLWRTPIAFATVTNAGNLPDPATGKGAVPYEFRIGRFEVNNHQYAAFLNSVAADDPNRLYDSNMTVTVHGGILRTGSPGDYAYAVKPGMGHRPVVWVDFHDAARFCNWLHHGQPTGPQDATTTEDGAYTLTAAAITANTVTRKPGARFWLPSDDEWYKAAYHQPLGAGGDFSDYWPYPTRSYEAPYSEAPPGGANSANACCETGRLATDVGAYINSPSYYGTFDQAGNVQEWTEEVIYVTNRRVRGGSWVYNEFYSESDDFEFDTPDYPADGIGFRVAGAAEP